MIDKKANIKFSILQVVEVTTLSDIVEILNNSELDIVVDVHPPRAYASIDWAVPGAIAVFISGGFFQEIGKDSYLIFKDLLAKILIKAKNISVKKLTSSGVYEYNDNYLKSITIYFELSKNMVLSVLFDKRLSLEENIKLKDNIFNIVLEYHSNKKDNIINDKIKILPYPYMPLYAVVDLSNMKWVILDLDEMRKINNNI